MSVQETRLSADEVVDRGKEIYTQRIRALVEPEHNGEVIAIDIHTGEFEIGDDPIPASRRLRARLPEAEVYLNRVGEEVLGRIRTPFRLLPRA